MPISKPIIIIGQSGRAMAKSARLAGIPSYVMDNFADMDTREYSLEVKKIPAITDEISSMNIKSMLDDYYSLDIAGIIIGSGFEDRLEIYCQLDEKFFLLGNSPETVKKIKDPQQFFPRLQKLGIKYPPTSLTIPKNTTGWLAKKTGGSGGVHIQPADDDVRDNYYYQKFMSGRSVSAVFLAYEDQATLVGISETWSRNPANMEFAYTGAMTLDLLDTPLANSIIKMINLITSEFKLKGLCGIDCIIDDSNQVYVLEVNPRPVATFELYEIDTSLIGLHINACLGIRDNFIQKRQDLVRAHKIVYADADFFVPEFIWPAWTTDRPITGSLITKGAPVCSIMAEHSLHGQIKILLQQREHQLIKGLGVQSIAA